MFEFELSSDANSQRGMGSMPLDVFVALRHVVYILDVPRSRISGCAVQIYSAV